MIVAGLQLDLGWESPQQSLARAAALAGRAAAAGARLLVLPEMFATGFTMSTALAAAAAAPSRAAMAEIARRHRVWVAGGLVLEGRERARNAGLLLDPDGQERLRYDKAHPFSLAGEDRHYEAGDGLATTEVEGVRVALLVCYDLRFPELFRAVADRVDLFVVLANWPERRGHAWRTLLAARALDAQAYVLGVNRVGAGGGESYRGDSSLVDPYGVAVAAAAVAETVVVGEVRADEVGRCRERFGFLADRRPALYRRLEEEGAAPRTEPE